MYVNFGVIYSKNFFFKFSINKVTPSPIDPNDIITDNNNINPFILFILT